MIKKGSPPITAERNLIMTIEKFRWNFHLFDGEGGGDAGEATASSSESKQDHLFQLWIKAKFHV